MTENELLAFLGLLWALVELTRCVLAHRKAMRAPRPARQPEAPK